MSTSSTERNQQVWKDATASHPCPKCDGTSWCRVSEDGDWCICRRTSAGADKTKQDRNGETFYLHRLRPGRERKDRYPEPTVTMASGNGKKADADVLHRVYTALISNCLISAEESQELLKRGLHDVRARAGYRTLGKDRCRAVAKLIEAGLEPLLPTVPGIVIRDKGKGPYWSVNGPNGLVVPVRNPKGQIIKLMVRLRNPLPNTKYLSLSSKKQGGPSPGNPTHFPLASEVKDRTIVRITEGPLKADAASLLSGVYTIGLPSVNGWRNAVKALRLLKAKTARVSYDRDARTNRNVAGHLANLVRLLQRKGFTVELEVWPLEHGKGIDDVLHAGHQPDVLTGEAVEAEVAKIVAEANVNDPPPRNHTPVAEDPSHPPESITDPHRLARRWTGEYAVHPDRPTIAYFRSMFWRWRNLCWQQIPDKEIESEVCRDVKCIIDADYPAWAEAVTAGTDKAPPPVPKVTSALVSNVLLALRGAHLIGQETAQPSWLEGERRPKTLIACANGLLDVDALLRGESDVLLPHTPLWFTPCCAPYQFDSKADCPTWRKVIGRSLGDDAGKHLLLQQFAGYLLTFDLSLQKFLEMQGEGSNGKSVVLAVFAAMLGEDNVCAVPLELFADKFRLAGTLGKLANLSAEIGEMDKMAEGHLKAFVSGDAMEFEQKFKQPFRAVPTARLVFSTNNSPQYSDRSDGIYRRRIVLPFKIQIPPSEQIPNLDKAEYWRQSGELPGILNWALAGLVSLRRAGQFTIPESCKSAAEKLRVDSDPARRFLLEHYEAGSGKVEKLAIYKHYRLWATERGHCPMAEVGFGRAVCRVFPAVNSEERVMTTEGRKTAYGGLKARSEPIPS